MYSSGFSPFVSLDNGPAFDPFIQTDGSGVVERKQFCHGVYPLVVSSAAADPVFKVNNMEVGTGDMQRVGRQVRMRAVTVQGTINKDGDFVEPVAVRMLLLWDLQGDATDRPTLGTFFTDPQTGLFDPQNLNQNLQMYLSGRYKVIWDALVTLNAGATSVGTLPGLAFQKRVEIPGWMTTYATNAANTGPASGGSLISTGAIWFVLGGTLNDIAVSAIAMSCEYED